MQRKSFGKMACPIARSLERVGEWWSILIIRDALHGFTRFDEFQKSLNIAPNILTRRLSALVDAGLFQRRRYSERPPRYEYILTEKGGDFRPLIVAMLAWGNRTFAPDGASVMLAQASTGLIETWWVSHLGTDALAGMALVFPVVMLMQMVSAGAMGGGISSAVARALGSGRRDQADALVMHAIVVNVALGAFFSIVMLVFGPSIYRALGGADGELQTALSYSNVVFAGNVLLWLMNALASVIRGTGNMLVPAMVICLGVVVLVPLSPCLIFGVGPLPELGVAGAGLARVLFYAAGTAVLLWYILSGRNVARFRMTRLSWPLFRDILAVGAVAAVTSLQTNLTIAAATTLVAR